MELVLHSLKAAINLKLIYSSCGFFNIERLFLSKIFRDYKVYILY